VSDNTKGYLTDYKERLIQHDTTTAEYYFEHYLLWDEPKMRDPPRSAEEREQRLAVFEKAVRATLNEDGLNMYLAVAKDMTDLQSALEGTLPPVKDWKTVFRSKFTGDTPADVSLPDVIERLIDLLPELEAQELSRQQQVASTLAPQSAKTKGFLGFGCLNFRSSGGSA
jgi:hypothetical protein